MTNESQSARRISRAVNEINRNYLVKKQATFSVYMFPRLEKIAGGEKSGGGYSLLRGLSVITSAIRVSA